jgi:hypothetical protein
MNLTLEAYAGYLQEMIDKKPESKIVKVKTAVKRMKLVPKTFTPKTRKKP